MDPTADGCGRSTRRTYLKGGALLAGGLLAGCLGGGDPDPTTAASGAGAETTTGGGTADDETTERGESESWTVSMAPVGDVTFDAVPEKAMVYDLLYADMAVAYGHGDAVNSLGFSAETGGETLGAFYDRLDGVSFDPSGLKQLNSGSGGGVSVDKELFYELDSDVHFVDPCLMLSFDGWERKDVDEIGEQVAPWFGNNFSRAHSQPPKPCRDEYEYYTLWQIGEKISAVFREGERFRKLKRMHDSMLDEIGSNLPPKKERPSVGAVIFMDGTFYPSKISGPGFSNAHVRPLEAPDAFGDGEITYETSYDYEAMLEYDPDVVLHSYGIASYYDVGEIRKTLEDHPVGGQLTAVKNDRVYPSANPVQGPIMNLFQTEMTAKQLYPEQFGEWPDYEAGSPYPEIPAEEQLFDREKLADIVTGSS